MTTDGGHSSPPPPGGSTDWRAWFTWLDDVEEAGGSTRGLLKMVAEKCGISYSHARKPRTQ